MLRWGQLRLLMLQRRLPPQSFHKKHYLMLRLMLPLMLRLMLRLKLQRMRRRQLQQFLQQQKMLRLLKLQRMRRRQLRLRPLQLPIRHWLRLLLRLLQLHLLLNSKIRQTRLRRLLRLLSFPPFWVIDQRHLLQQMRLPH
jgi:hypothetical protein